MPGAIVGAAQHGSATVTATPTKLGLPFGNRTNITIFNNDTATTLYVGTDSTVTTNTGFPVYPQQSISLDWGPQMPIFGVSASSISVRWLEAY